MSTPSDPIRLLALATHELRTPAGVVGGCLAILRMSGSNQARQEQALAQADRSYGRLLELLDEMSDLWRLDAGEATFNRRPLPLRSLLERMAAGPARLTPELPLLLDVDDLDGVLVNADPVRLTRALEALVAAVARQSLEPQILHLYGRVAATPHAVVRLLVSTVTPADVLSVEEAPRAFDEYQSGLGLSLPIACRVIRADGGSVHALGSGRETSVLVLLPTCT